MLECKGYCIPKNKLNLLSYTELDEYDITSIFQFGMSRLSGRDNGDRVIRTLHKRQVDGFFVECIVAPEQNSELNFTKNEYDGATQNIRPKCPSREVEFWHHKLGHSDVPAIKKMIATRGYGMGKGDRGVSQ